MIIFPSLPNAALTKAWFSIIRVGTLEVTGKDSVELCIHEDMVDQVGDIPECIVSSLVKTPIATTLVRWLGWCYYGHHGWEVGCDSGGQGGSSDI